MELKVFIADTIKQIADGLVEGHKYVKEKSPRSEGVRSEYRRINFDVAVTTTEGEKDEVGGKVSVAQIFKVGGSAESSNATSNSSRIQFDIFIHVHPG